MLAFELLVGLAGRLEHREGEGAAARWGGDDAGGEAEEGVVARAGEHVDHARLGVGADLEEELAQPVDDLVPAVDESQLARELGRPLRQLLDVGEVGEDLVAGRGQGGGDGVMPHLSIHSFSPFLTEASRRSPSRSSARAPSSASARSATGSNLRALAVRTTRNAR